MQIIGIITAIYAEEWIAPAIEQALAYCDKVVVSVGAHCEALQVLEDDTLKIAKEFEGRVRVVAPVVKQSHVAAKGPTMNRMLDAAEAKAGDWIWVLDCDEFYFPNTVDKLKGLLENAEVGTISIGAKLFFIDMQHYVKSNHKRLFRIAKGKERFRKGGAQSWESDGLHVNVGLEENEIHGMFHYSLLTSPKYRRLFWETEKKGKEQDRKVLWHDSIYMPFALEEEDYWVDKSTELMGMKRRSPIWTPSFSPQPNGNLFSYTGPHPEVIESAGLHKIKDFRTYRD